MITHAATRIALAKSLRKKGHSLGEIVKKSKMPKTTVWHHIKDVVIPEEYIAVFAKKQAGSVVRSARQWDRARKHAKSFSPRKIDTHRALLIASMLYWGEGTKRDFNLANSDPDLVKLFMFCMSTLGLGPERFALHVRTYSDLDKSKAVAYWRSVTDIPAKNVVGIEVIQGKKAGKLPYGMCRIRLYKGQYELKLLTAAKEHIIELMNNHNLPL